MANGGFEVEEWDADFLDQLVQAEELALSAATQQCRPPPPPPPPVPQTLPPTSFLDISYSPPRELSQRVRETAKNAFQASDDSIFRRAKSSTASSSSITRPSDGAQEQEIDRLKKELARVSKQLTFLENDCIELKKERDKKEEQLRCIYSHKGASDFEHCGAMNLSKGYNVHMQDGQAGLLDREHASTLSGRGAAQCKDVGVQTDKSYESISLEAKNDDHAEVVHSRNKLSDLWEPLRSQKLGRYLVSRLLVSCETDLCMLFGWLKLSLPEKAINDSWLGQSRAVSVHLLPHIDSAEAAKVSRLYTAFAKINDDTTRLEDLLEAILDLCRLDNVQIVYRSLRVLHIVLKLLFSMERTCAGSNLLCEGQFSKSAAEGNAKANFQEGNLDCLQPRGALNQGLALYNEGMSGGEEKWMESFSCQLSASISHIHGAYLVELMCQAVMKYDEQYVRAEAVSIMNIILLRSNDFLERNDFPWELVFRCISEVIKKEGGLHARKAAIDLLYRALNSPKVMDELFNGHNEAGDSVDTGNWELRTSGFGPYGSIFDGLADCIVLSENSAEVLNLRKKVIVLLAYLASTGKSGFQVLLTPCILRGTNLITTIIYSLVSDLDHDASESRKQSQVFKERTLLFREVLILLNRLVSNQQYSLPVLQALTCNREIASLTIEMASRLSSKRKCLSIDDSITRKIRESEIVELARLFKKRVFAFLGDSIS